MLFTGGLFAANQGRWAILITMSYAVYSAKVSCGWFGLILCLALAFVSSDVALHFLNTDKEEKFSKSKSEYAPPPPQQKTSKGRASEGSMPNSEQFQANVDGARTSTGASTSGINEGDPLSAEEEVIRVLGCIDHYAVLGFARYDNFDVSSLKREYRKKVHVSSLSKDLLACFAGVMETLIYRVLGNLISCTSFEHEWIHLNPCMEFIKQMLWMFFHFLLSKLLLLESCTLQHLQVR